MDGEDFSIVPIPSAMPKSTAFIRRWHRAGIRTAFIRASTGAIFSVPLAETSSEEAVEWFRAHNIRTVAASPHSTEVYTDLDMTQGIALVVGAEQYGLTDYWMKGADINVQIPMLGRMDSLNVATAATILLYEAARQRKWKPSRA